ncbi:MAG TPA: hypothetical protein VMA34_08210 [Terracidiphilus sp.]|nr:hypothetical protein [Terracidiphilus sp.]
MLRLVEYGLLAVSLFVVVGLIMRSPRAPAPGTAENGEAEKGQIGKG